MCKVCRQKQGWFTAFEHTKTGSASNCKGYWNGIQLAIVRSMTTNQLKAQLAAYQNGLKLNGHKMQAGVKHIHEVCIRELSAELVRRTALATK